MDKKFYFRCMYKALYTLSVLLIATCNSSEKKQEATTQNAPAVNHDTVVTVSAPPTQSIQEEEIINVGDSTLVIGNFDGDNVPDSGYFVVVDKYVSEPEPDVPGEGDDHSDPVLYNYVFRFRDQRLNTLPNLSGGAVMLVNEGDLNHDGTDEISVLQQYLIIGSGVLNTYTYQNGKWKQIAEMGLATSANAFSRDEVEKLIRKKDSIPYFYEQEDAAGRILEIKP